MSIWKRLKRLYYILTADNLYWCPTCRQTHIYGGYCFTCGTRKERIPRCQCGYPQSTLQTYCSKCGVKTELELSNQKEGR